VSRIGKLHRPLGVLEQRPVAAGHQSGHVFPVLDLGHLAIAGATPGAEGRQRHDPSVLRDTEEQGIQIACVECRTMRLDRLIDGVYVGLGHWYTARTRASGDDRSD
jgi:hypothetical protein